MRVISGKFKGKRLFSPTDNRIRPTTDRIKETMFNILFSKGADFQDMLDLFSGSGALGIEALSRGANNAVFIDRDANSIKLTKENLSHVGANDYEIYHTDFTVALKKLKGRKFDVIFADPPYSLRLESKIIEGVMENELLKADGILIIEHSKENELQIDSKSFIMDERYCGNTVLSFITLTGEAISE